MGAAAQNVGFCEQVRGCRREAPDRPAGGISGQPILAVAHVRGLRQTRGYEGGIRCRRGGHAGAPFVFSLRISLCPDAHGPRRLVQFQRGPRAALKQMVRDYAFIPLGDLGTTHHLSINFRFKPKDDSVPAEDHNLTPAKEMPVR